MSTVARLDFGQNLNCDENYDGDVDCDENCDDDENCCCDDGGLRNRNSAFDAA